MEDRVVQLDKKASSNDLGALVSLNTDFHESFYHHNGPKIFWSMATSILGIQKIMDVIAKQYLDINLMVTMP